MHSLAEPLSFTKRFSCSYMRRKSASQPHCRSLWLIHIDHEQIPKISRIMLAVEKLTERIGIFFYILPWRYDHCCINKSFFSSSKMKCTQSLLKLACSPQNWPKRPLRHQPSKPCFCRWGSLNSVRNRVCLRKLIDLKSIISGRRSVN